MARYSPAVDGERLRSRNPNGFRDFASNSERTALLCVPPRAAECKQLRHVPVEGSTHLRKAGRRFSISPIAAAAPPTRQVSIGLAKSNIDSFEQVSCHVGPRIAASSRGRTFRHTLHNREDGGGVESQLLRANALI